MEHQEVRERIISTAESLFHTQGYNETGVNQIIKEAQVAKASLYYHFDTKDALCLAYLERRHESWCRLFYEFMQTQEQKAIAAFDFLMYDNENSNYRGCSFLNLLPVISPDQKEIVQSLQNHKQTLLLFFESEIADTELAFTIYSLFENAIIESQLYQNQEPVKRLQDISRKLLGLELKQ